MAHITVNTTSDAVQTALSMFGRCSLESLNNVRNLHSELYSEIRRTHSSEDPEFLAFCAVLAVWCAGYVHGRTSGPIKKKERR